MSSRQSVARCQHPASSCPHGHIIPLMPSFSNAFTPPGCSSSPTMRSGSFRLFSSSMTLLPCLPNATAAAQPSTPAPTMTPPASWWTRCLPSWSSTVCVAWAVGAACVEEPLLRSCGEGVALTPGGSSVSLVPEYMVNMAATTMGLVAGPAKSVWVVSDGGRGWEQNKKRVGDEIEAKLGRADRAAKIGSVINRVDKICTGNGQSKAIGAQQRQGPADFGFGCFSGEWRAHDLKPRCWGQASRSPPRAFCQGLPLWRAHWPAWREHGLTRNTRLVSHHHQSCS